MRREKQATQKAAFGFLCDKPQAVCEADNKHGVWGCEYDTITEDGINEE